jgi:hypothetical protein
MSTSFIKPRKRATGNDRSNILLLLDSCATFFVSTWQTQHVRRPIESCHRSLHFGSGCCVFGLGCDRLLELNETALCVTITEDMRAEECLKTAQDNLESRPMRKQQATCAGFSIDQVETGGCC